MAYFGKAVKINKYGRTYHQGKSLSMDIRSNVVDRALQGESFGEISRHLEIARSTVSKVVEIYRVTGSVEPLPKNNRNYNSKVTYEDSISLETIIGGSGATSLSEMQSELDTTADCGRVSLSTISRHIRNKLPSGNKYSRKKISKLATERFTNDNIIYTQLYLDYVSQKDPNKIKFFDESGFRLPNAGLRRYGYSQVGESCVEVQRYMATPNITLNFLAGVEGVKYANIVEGATNTIEFLRFFEEAANAIQTH